MIEIIEKYMTFFAESLIVVIPLRMLFEFIRSILFNKWGFKYG